MTTKQRLEKMVVAIATAQGRPLIARTGDAPRCVHNVGALELNHMPQYGGYDLIEISNATGGERSLLGNSFPGGRRLNGREMGAFLSGMLAAAKFHPLLTAAKDVVADLELFASRQGPGPDVRLQTLKTAIQAAENI